MRLPTRLIVASIAVTGLLTACTSVAPTTEPPSLDGSAWVLSALPGHAVLPGHTPTLRFEGGRAAGSDGCNRYSASYTVSGPALTIDPAGAMTQMACAPEVMAQAGAFMSGLTGARRYRVEAGELQLLDASGATLAVFAPQSQALAGSAWRVIGYNNGRQGVTSVLADTQLTLLFAGDGRLSGSAGCNNYTGTYTASGSSLRIGPTAATRKMCVQPERVMEQEQQFLTALETVATIRREGDRAELRRADGALAISMTQDSVE